MIRSNRIIFRILDIVFALLCTTVLLPLFLFISLLIKLDSKGPILFKQKRVGKDFKPFYIYKFRSMFLHHESPERLGPIKHNHTLVTRVGFILRRFKLDEIPQFINVLRGEMSIVGPRPCLYPKLDTMTYEEKRRFYVLPGITCWAEVNGNVELDWEEQLRLDLWYVDHKSFKLDLLIIWKTIVTIVFGSIKNEEALQKANKYLNTLNNS